MLNGLVLIGGKSTRMGTEKYQLAYNGKAQYLHVIDLLTEIDIPTYVSCNAQQIDQIEKATQIIPDEYQAIGPMGGILSAMRFNPKASWLVIACDLPLISSNTIEKLIANRKQDADVTTFQLNDRFFETTFSIYEPSAFQLLDQFRTQENYRLQAVF